MKETTGVDGEVSFSKYRCGIIAALAIVGLGASQLNAHAGVNFTNLIVFPMPSLPDGCLLQGRDGYFYVLSTQGGDWTEGAIVQIAPDGLYSGEISFPRPLPSGGPYSPTRIIQAADGGFYGTAQGGTNGGYGTVFHVDTNGVLSPRCIHLTAPMATSPTHFVQGTDGNFYGTTYAGGIGFSNGYNSSGFGTIFQVTTNGTFNTLAWFDGTNGANPEPSLLNVDGNLYGITVAGGSDTNAGSSRFGYNVGYGVIYEFPPNGDIQVLASFSHTNAGGAAYSLIHGDDGNFYGTTLMGGAYNFGTAFELTTNQTLTTIASFDGTNGAGPYCLLQAPDGNLYGGAHGDGDTPWPNIFELTPSGTVTSLFSFGLTNGWPDGLIQGADGDFYGTTQTGGGNGGWGTFFRASVPVGPVLQTAMPASGSFNLTWNAVAGQTYQVQFTSNSAQTNWTNLGGSIMATNGTLSLPDSPGSAQQRFYRVVIAP